jgi:hypothetical protein
MSSEVPVAPVAIAPDESVVQTHLKSQSDQAITLGAIARNESRYLPEWLAYHRIHPA